MASIPYVVTDSGEAAEAPDGAIPLALFGAGGESGPVAIADVTGLIVALGAKAPLAGPTFTGTPAAPTAPVATNTTQLATTAFVRASAGAGKAQFAALSAITTPDATDEASAITLANVNKSFINSIIAALKA